MIDEGCGALRCVRCLTYTYYTSGHNIELDHVLPIHLYCEQYRNKCIFIFVGLFLLGTRIPRIQNTPNVRNMQSIRAMFIEARFVGTEIANTTQHGSALPADPVGVFEGRFQNAWPLRRPSGGVTNHVFLFLMDFERK